VLLPPVDSVALIVTGAPHKLLWQRIKTLNRAAAAYDTHKAKLLQALVAS
jgi:hypothetical protein